MIEQTDIDAEMARICREGRIRLTRFIYPNGMEMRFAWPQDSEAQRILDAWSAAHENQLAELHTLGTVEDAS